MFLFACYCDGLTAALYVDVVTCDHGTGRTALHGRTEAGSRAVSSRAVVGSWMRFNQPHEVVKLFGDRQRESWYGFPRKKGRSHTSGILGGTIDDTRHGSPGSDPAQTNANARWIRADMAIMTSKVPCQDFRSPSAMETDKSGSVGLHKVSLAQASTTGSKNLNRSRPTRVRGYCHRPRLHTSHVSVPMYRMFRQTLDRSRWW